ncbi:MAG: LTA synthase family protein, partial [Clostridia bacterium]|nr:LTA synthase family protein [Clostridia bacterium]
RSELFRHAEQRLQEALLLGVAPVALCYLMEAFSRRSLTDPVRWLLGAPVSFALTWALWLGVCLLLSLCRSYRLRWLLVTALGFLASGVGLINRYKMRYRMEPVFFSDMYQLGDALEALRCLPLSVDRGEAALLCAALAVGVALCLALARGRRSRRRVALPVAGALIFVLAWNACTFERVGGRTRYDTADVARTEGVLYTAVAMQNHLHGLLDMPYHEQEVRQAWQTLARNTPPAGCETGPNIILILSESYSDEQWLSQYLDLTCELTPFYNALVQTCLHGRMYVPKAGGGTSETEFEVLTGLRSCYSLNPYAMGLPPLNSLASVLRARGYTATAIHWYSGVYYNRYNNFRQLGFQSFHTTDTSTAAFQTTGMFVSDAEHYSAALRQLKSTPSRDFVFVLTMQNHGGYDYDDFRVTCGAPQPFTNALSDESTLILSNYCYLLGQSDAALKAFIGELQQWEEPVLVVFFGDHIPPLGQNVYDELGVDASGREGHMTPYFVWSNQANTARERELYAWQLGAYALTAAGQNDDPFLHYVESLQTEEDGLHALLSYDALFGRQYVYDEAGLSPVAADYRIGGEMTLQGFDAAQVGDAVYLRPRLAQADQACKLSVNAQLTDAGWVSADSGRLALQCVMNGFGGVRWNASNTLIYESAQALLSQSGALSFEQYGIDALEPVESKWYRPYAVYRTPAVYSARGCTALTVDGQRWEWQPVYGLSRQGQYAVDGEGRLYLTLARGEDAQAYVLAHRIDLYAFDP